MPSGKIIIEADVARATAEIRKLTKEQKDLNSEIRKQQRALDKAKEGTNEYATASAKLQSAKAKLANQNQELLALAKDENRLRKLSVNEIRNVQNRLQAAARADRAFAEQAQEGLQKISVEYKRANDQVRGHVKVTDEGAAAKKELLDRTRDLSNLRKKSAVELKELKERLEAAARADRAFSHQAQEGLQRVNAEYRRANDLVRGYSRETREASTSTKALTKVGLALGAALAIGQRALTSIADYGEQIGNLVRSMDSMQRKAEIVFEDTLPQVTESAEENAQAMGLTTKQYVAAAAGIQDILIPMGFQREEATGLTIDLANLSGALAEWTGGQYDSAEVSDILTKALTGEREQLKSLGIVIQEEDVKRRLAQKGLEDLTGEYLQQAKAIATLELITEKSIDAQTKFANSSGSIARNTAETRANISKLTESIAERLTPAYANVAERARFFTEAVADYLKVKQSEKLREEQVELNVLVGRITDANTAQEDRNALIEQLQKDYPKFLDNLDAEKVTNDQLISTLKDVNQQYVARIALQELQEQIETQAKRVSREELRTLKDEQKLREEIAKITSDFGITEEVLSGAETLEGRLKIINEELSKNAEFSTSARSGVTSAVNDEAKALRRIQKIQGEIRGNDARRERKEERLLELQEFLNAATQQYSEILDGINDDDDENNNDTTVTGTRSTDNTTPDDQLTIDPEEAALRAADAKRLEGIMLLEVGEELGALEIDQKEAIERRLTEIEKRERAARTKALEAEVLAAEQLEQRKRDAAKTSLSSAIEFLGILEEEQGRSFKITKALTIAQLGINLGEELSNVSKNATELGPVLGPIYLVTRSALALGKFASNVAQVKKSEPKTAAKGIRIDSRGNIYGPSHGEGGIDTIINGQRVEVEGGERVVQYSDGTIDIINKISNRQYTHELDEIVKTRVANINGRHGIRFAQDGIRIAPSSVPDTTPRVSASSTTTEQVNEDKQRILQAQEEQNTLLRGIAAQLARPVRSYVVYDDIESTATEINEIEQKASI